MKFGHYWPKGPTAKEFEHLRPAYSPIWPIDMGSYWRHAEMIYGTIVSPMQYIPMTGGGDGRAEDTPEARARAVQRVRDTVMGGVCGTVRHLP